MTLPVYALSLPRPLSWAAAAGLYGVRLPWGVAVGLAPNHLPSRPEPALDSSLLRVPAWVLFHASTGPGEHSWHKRLPILAAERGLRAPAEVPKGSFSGFAQLEAVVPHRVIPADKAPEDESWHLAWTAELRFSRFHLVQEPEHLYVGRDWRLPPLWLLTDHALEVCTFTIQHSAAEVLEYAWANRLEVPEPVPEQNEAAP